MSIRDFARSQYIEIIEWVDEGKDIIIHKFPDEDREIKMNAQLIVRDSQVAIFLNEGQLADVFTPGRYELSAKNIPVLSRLKGWKYGFSSPFKADVYFVSTKQFISKKWGTANPVLMRDPELGVIRLRAFGKYGFRITNAKLFFKEISGTNSIYTTDGVYDHLRSRLVSVFSDIVGKAKLPVVDMVGNYNALGSAVLENSRANFESIGVEISSFVVENIALPPEVEKYVDKKSSMGVVGDMKAFTEFQVADSIPDAATNPGGVAGLGAGFVMGKKIADTMMGSETKQGGASNDKNIEMDAKKCNECDMDNPSQAKFCVGCGNNLTEGILCKTCNTKLPEGAKFCFSCGKSVEVVSICKKCGAKLEDGAKFCMECGEKTAE